MSRKFKFHADEGIYMTTFTVLQWIDVFNRDSYRELFLESVRYCQQNKGLRVHAWVIMTNHVHMIISSEGKMPLNEIVRDLKSYTSRHIRKSIEQNDHESRREWMLWHFRNAGIRNSNNKDFQFWQQHNHPVLLDTEEKLNQRLHYLHYNPVKAGFVTESIHWRWSSAGDYEEGNGLLDIDIIY